MDTPTIAEYYREQDPVKRKEILKQSIDAGEEPENNAIRMELYNNRYHVNKGNAAPADIYLRLWMTLEFNRDAANRLFGIKKARRDITKDLESIKFTETLEKGGAYEELLYRECLHLVSLYMDLCATDKNYNSYLLGIINMKKESSEDKLRSDIYKTAVKLPNDLGMQKELGMFTKAAREAYSLHFKGETLPEE